MHSAGDFDSLTIVVALVVSICGLLAVLAFLLWLARGGNGKRHPSAGRGKRSGPARKNRQK